MNPIVCIVGLPNAGKSTLFNRLIGAPKAIVDDLPGITRDRCYDLAEWCGHTFTLIDTGGYVLDHPNPMEETIAQQVQTAVQEADAILFMVDAQLGINTQQRALVKLLRKYNKPILLVANKADNHALAHQVHHFHALNIGAIYPISAMHGSGTGELLDALIAHFKEAEEEETEEREIPKVALMGRPNQGKSTFLNSLLGEQRSIVSEQPHTTRTPIHSHYRLYDRDLLLIDTAGIRKKSQVSPHTIEFYSLLRSIRTIEEADVCMLFIDAQEGLTDQDKNIITLIRRRKKGLILLANKWDKLKNQGINAIAYKKELIAELPLLEHVPILLTSGLHKKGIYQTVEKAIEVYKNLKQRLPTSKVNNVILKAVGQHEPPVSKGKRIKIKYATQLPTPSPTFALFCNLPQYIPATYKRYLERQLRTYFSLEGAPVTLVFKKK